MSTEELLSQIYPPKDCIPTKHLLEKYNLSKVILIAVNKVYEACNQPSSAATNNNLIFQFSSISSSFLTSINSKISLITNLEEKRQVELIVSDIAFELLKGILDKFSGDNILLLKAISDALQTACEFNGYNFSGMLERFPLQKYIDVQPKNKVAIVYPVKPVYYKWHSLPVNLDELAVILKSKNAIRSVKEFYKLFEYPKEKVLVSFNREFHDEIFVLFDVLFAKGFVSTVGGKGHFLPIKLYGVDFENNPLINSEPKTIKYTLKKNAKKWLELNTQIDKWLLNFKSQKLSQSLP